MIPDTDDSLVYFLDSESGEIRFSTSHSHIGLPTDADGAREFAEDMRSKSKEMHESVSLERKIYGNALREVLHEMVQKRVGDGKV